MTKVDQLAATLKQLTPRQLQQLMTRTSNRDGSAIRAKKIARTETYFDRIRAEGLYPYKYDTFTQFREVVE